MKKQNWPGRKAFGRLGLPDLEGFSVRTRLALGLVLLLLTACAEPVNDGSGAYSPLPSPTPRATLQITPASGPMWVIRPAPTATPTLSPSPTPTTLPLVHIVRQGDTLASIAATYHVTVLEIMAANELGRPDAIRPGDRLLIERPGITPTPAMPAPTPGAGS